MSSREQYSKEKKEHIFRTAMKMFRDRGYKETTVRDICKAADISHSTFYHYFGDKSGLLADYFRRVLDHRNLSLNPTPEHLAHPFQAVYDYIITIAKSQDMMGRDFIRETMYADPRVYAAQELSATRQSGMHDIAQFLRSAREAGTVPGDLDPEETAEYLIVGAGGMLFTWVTFSPEERAVDMMRRLLPKFFAAVTDEAIRT